LRRLARFVWRAIQGVALALLAFMLIVYFTPIVPWFAARLAGAWTYPKGDILIVLSADAHSDGLPGPVTYGRAIYAVRTWRSGHFQSIVLCGGKMGTPVTLASAMRDVLVSYGVPANVIYLEDRSHSTRENALFASALIHDWPGQRVLLTSDIHMFRAARVFRKAGVPVVADPIPDVLKTANARMNRWNAAIGLIVEGIKIVYYAARGWM
jgi:uncharacterized SAM-binding protein YcdF (DUF218 family)